MSSSDRKKSRSSSASCWSPFRSNSNSNSNKDEGQQQEPLLWSRDLDKHFLGEYSFAVFQANHIVEDHSQVEVGRNATFIGVYDGHGGPEASRFISDHLFHYLIKLARDNRTMSEDIIRNALTATEDGFLKLVSRTFRFKPIIAAIGSCCLVGVIWQGTVYIANLGDSRAVIGCLNRSNKIVAEQLTKEHNACMEEVREELISSHPDDSSILVMKQGVWRIKGIIQVSRSIGDAYLKSPDLALDPSFPRFNFPEPIRRPVLSAEPSIYTRVLQPSDQFLIFASDGLWEHLTNQEAVQIVHNSPRAGIAKKLIHKALKKVAKRMNMKDEDLKKVEKGERRKYHDDITVVVIFLDHDLLNENVEIPEVSVQGFGDTAGPSKFSLLKSTT
ncbi:putative protein phosphatase 2C 25 [Silene latifolia]|uniref:putative protein phosphatase 2C 25 n=1 Tax=Silene latifolia TaxID=37657 RepID=UPI003D77EFBF